MNGNRTRSSQIIIAVATASLFGCGGGDDTVPAQALSAKEACDSLVGKTLDGGEIVSAALVAATDANTPEHCLVAGRIAGSEINFVAKLPSTWNGKARMGASGGWQGSLSSANSPAGIPSPISKGYVDYVTDSGHTGKTPPGAAFDSTFSTKSEALANFAGLAHQRTTVAVKAIVKQRYGREAERTYFEGCSGGGHIALLMAQRYPRLFDGIIAGAPAPNFVGTFLGWQRPAKALAVPGALPSPAKLATLSNAILKQCDKLDGIEDGIVSNPLACNFNPEPLRCTGADSDSCLTDAQMNLVKEITTDTVFRDGSLLVKGLRLVGHEDDANNWPFWLSGTPSLFHVATQSVISVLTRNPSADPLTYSILDDEVNIKNLSSVIDAWPGNLSEFGAAGGKLIIWNGTADTPVPFENQIVYHNSAVASLGGAAKAQQTMRTYFPPGVNHCGAGAGADRFEYLEALDSWVTKNEPPDGKKMSKFVNGQEALSRPLCPYPTWPKYNGTGNVNSAASFTCGTFP
jgi:feruloyl esterase